MSTTSPSPTSISPTSPETLPIGKTLPPTEWTMADVLSRLGNVPPERIRVNPAPGTATIQDVIDLDDHHDRLCELVDGILVEKTMGFDESNLALVLAHILGNYLEKHNLGIMAGEAGMMEILPNQVRIPDISFIRWERYRNRKNPKSGAPFMAPDLAVEIISPSNSKGEMDRKLHDYFSAGVKLVWYIDPATRSAKAYTAPDQCRNVDENGSLSGGDVLPGFTLPLKDLFARIEGPK
ncbi:MAG: Uma2 family endonuclease [Pirellulales bacterium]|nr:Uma2 family endonuclease [Pirellulales bacterium]